MRYLTILWSQFANNQIIKQKKRFYTNKHVNDLLILMILISETSKCVKSSALLVGYLKILDVSYSGYPENV